MKGYLSSERTYRYKELSIVVMPGVFHPGLFHSTSLLLQYIETHSMAGSILEMGGGTGVVSILAAKKGAKVTSIDISSRAIHNMNRNAVRNGVSITVIQSDLFEKIEKKTFDWILVNPPYYPAIPTTEEDYAWYCGDKHDYFTRFFIGVQHFMGPDTTLIMVLSEVCDLQTIFKIAAGAGFSMEKIAEKSVWVDGKNYLFQVTQTL